MAERYGKLQEENPRRLVRLIREIREVHFDGCSLEEMARKLQHRVRYTTGENPKPVASFTRNVVHNLELGRAQIRYIHIETYAQLVGMRAGALLLFSYFQHDPVHSEIEANVRAMAKFYLPIVQRNGVVSVRDLKGYAELIDMPTRARQRPRFQQKDVTELDMQSTLFDAGPNFDVDADFAAMWEPLPQLDDD